MGLTRCYKTEVFLHLFIIMTATSLNWNRWSTSLYVIHCCLTCGQRGSTCARHITLDWIQSY